MNLIRGFLWFLVAVMTLQGFLHADEYGAATTMIGGIGLTMSVWRESIGTSARSLWSSEPNFIPVPRAIVQAALKETALHPGIKIVPKLQQKLRDHQRTWELFREKEVHWLLEHSDLIGGLLSDPDARWLWTQWDQALQEAEASLQETQPRACKVRLLDPATCDSTSAIIEHLERTRQAAQEAVKQWDLVLRMNHRISAGEWWASIRAHRSEFFGRYEDTVARLHDIENPSDPRISDTLALATNVTIALATGESVWIQRLLLSLLTGELWTGCLEHVRSRESRVRELMILAGIQELTNTHERILNASLRTLSTLEERRAVQDWFGEMTAYAWWMPEDMPALVRRCIGQDAGDCTRIGPTEIVALTAKVAEKARIMQNWTRRLFLGLWNAMPVVGILFILELVVLCTELRSPQSISEKQKSFVLRLEGGGDSRQLALSERGE
jgi:hypothetical protein